MNPQNFTLTKSNATALRQYAELVGWTLAKFLYASLEFEALKKAANEPPDLT
jgi:hypothetical protein